jgi:nitrogenase delta subunit
MDEIQQEKVEQLVNYIMKWSLWQFNSREWDREKQNEEILKKTMQLLCDEPVENETPEDRYYWSEAMVLSNDFKTNFEWISQMNKKEIKKLIEDLKNRIDYLTITGSLNAELKVKRY